MITIGAAPLTISNVAAIARDRAGVSLADSRWQAIAAAHATLLGLIARNAPIYGVSTGLGAAVDTAVRAETAEAQRRIPLARAVGVGRRAQRAEVRAMMAARLAGLAEGRSGASPAITAALLAMLNRAVHPVVPMVGSVGEADLPPLAHIACVLAGEGEAEFAGELLPAAEALARAGISPPAFGPKDGLALVSSNAASVGVAALVLADARCTLHASLAAAGLSFEGFRASLDPLDPRGAAIRPAPGQEDAARRLRALLEGGDLCAPGAARRLQDPLSFRVIASVHGAAAEALQRAIAAVELELNSADDNPAILVEDDTVLPNANFDPTHLALALETLGGAIVRAASCAAGRVLQQMSSETCGLPRFLAPPPRGSNGFATAQKTIAALLAEMQHRAAPLPAMILPVADRIEDYGTMATAIVTKTQEIVEHWQAVAAIELMVAAQACDLRGNIRLGRGTRAVHDTVRSAAAPLVADRPTGADIEALTAMIRNNVFGLVCDKALPAA
jgi:histidine ammonia-lyase